MYFYSGLHKGALLLGCAVSVVLIAPCAYAQEKVADGPDTAAEEMESVIVTGSARAERRFDVSYAVNSLSQDQIGKIAPLNYADLVGTMPGIQVEATGGEVQNITRVRGIPTDRGYLIFQQDGLPLYQEIDGVFFNAGEGMNRYDLMTERVEVVRGGPSPIYASDAAAISNNITATGTDVSRGKAQITIGDTGLYRADAMQSGPLGDGNYYAIGGFLRYHDGYRDNGFPNDRGGQIRANFKHDLSNGWIRVSANYLNDHNVFYLPIPVADPRNPSVSLNPYIDYFTGTMNTPSLRNVDIKYLDATSVAHTLHRDLSNGRHIRFANFGLQYEGNFGDWLVSAKAGFTDGKLSFDAFYSTTNPADATSFAAGYLASAQSAFGTTTPVARLGYAIAGTSGATAYDPAAASGLVMSAQYRAVESDFYSNQADVSVTRKFQTVAGAHDIRAGFYGSMWGVTSLQAYQDYLIEVAGKPRTLDLVAYSASGSVLGYVTSNGALRDTTTLNQGKTDGKLIALYANDTWTIFEGLRLDAGIRHEWYSYTGYAALSKSVNMGDATTLADDSARAFTGAVNNLTLHPKATNWTVGLNYDFDDNFGTYGRISHLEVPPQATVALSTSPTIVTNKAEQYEVGFKASFGRSYLYLTGFYTKFDPLNASFAAYNPVTGRSDQTMTFIGTAVSQGVELDGAYSPFDWFSVAGSLTVSSPEYKDLQNSVGADPSAVNGNQIVREPKIFGNVRPTFNFDIDDNQIEIYGHYQYTGKRYVDFFNQTALPSYATLGAGLTVTHNNWRFQVVADNLTDAHGLTEGNPRTDTLSGQGSKDAVYGRPLFGRNFRFVIGTNW